MDIASEGLALISKEARDLREMWQGRALVAVEGHGRLSAVLLSVLAHNFDEAMPILLRVVFPGFTSINAPFLCSAGKIAKTGAVVADVIDKDGRKHTGVPLYRNETALRDDFRKLADRMKLSDADRVEMFKCVQRWVVADMRLDPNMDPKDPDAKRLVLH